MKTKISLALILLATALPLAALDLGGALEKATQGTTDKALQEMTKKLKAVQNEKGPIVFVTGKADLDAKKCLNTLKAIDGIVKAYPIFKVTIEGHTDNKGGQAVNKKLSQARAEAVVAWLKANLQTPAERLKAQGFGDSKPIADNKTEGGRAKNRRVDFSVTRL